MGMAAASTAEHFTAMLGDARVDTVHLNGGRGAGLKAPHSAPSRAQELLQISAWGHSFFRFVEPGAPNSRAGSNLSSCLGPWAPCSALPVADNELDWLVF